MKTKILMIVMLLGISTLLVAQSTGNVPGKFHGKMAQGMKMRDGRGPAQGLNLTDVQKASFKSGIMAIQKQLQPLKNELGELEAHQKSLVMAEKPDQGAINKNIEKIGALRVEMAKIQTKHRLEMRAQLTDEQRLKIDLMKGKMKDGKGPRGMKRGMM
ncbi:MAG: Spy/CpxP family protein refolding chaperone [Prolixibacteraceae bacterium]